MGGEHGLDSADPGVRRDALERVIADRNRALLPACRVRAAAETNPQVRSLLVLALAVLGGRDELASVSPFLADPHPDVRSSGVRALELIGSGRAYIMMIGSLRDPDSAVRAIVVRSLHQLGEEKLLRCCEAMLASSHLWMRRAAAFCVAMTDAERATHLVVRATEDQDPEVRSHARSGIERLAARGDARAAEYIATLADTEPRALPLFAHEPRTAQDLVEQVETLQEPGVLATIDGPDDDPDRTGWVPSPGESAARVPVPGALRYRIVREIGKGGMGRVVLAHDDHLGRDVAMKMLRDVRGAEGAIGARFLEEARATARLDHPNIIPLYDLGSNLSGQPYFTMRWVKGTTLESLVDGLRRGEVRASHLHPFVSRLQIVLKICDAMAYAHARGVIHRDLKPANVMVGEFGEVLVMDWGLARGDPNDGRAPTLEGTVMGTPAYMAPEQAAGRVGDVDERSDVFSLGCIAYELFTLRQPHAGQTSPDLLKAVMNEVPPTPESLVVDGQPRVPREIGLIIMRALAKERADRFQSAAQVQSAIHSYLAGQSDVVCAHTAAKRVLARFSHFVDQHSKPGILLLALFLSLAVLAPLALLAVLATG